VTTTATGTRRGSSAAAWCSDISAQLLIKTE
jgi:hypothetical protein